MTDEQRKRLEEIFKGGHEKALAEVYAEFFTPIETLQLAWLEYRFASPTPEEKEKNWLFLEAVKKAVRKTIKSKNRKQK